MTSYAFKSVGRPPGYEGNPFIELGKLNNDGDFIVSAWNFSNETPSKFFDGFIYEDGAYKSINYPGSSFTWAVSTNDRGQVVGEYASSQTNDRSNGFLYNGSTYEPLEIPGSRTNWANDINNNGMIVGLYADGNNLSHGYIYNSGSYTTIDGPGAIKTYLSGLNDRGVAVGGYSRDADASFGLVYENGTLQTLSYPGASRTNLSDISNDGTIVGSAYLRQTMNDPAMTIGFTYKNGVFDKVDGTENITGINDRGQLLARSADRNILISDPLCFVTGTLIRTMRGEVPVERLRVGDRVVTVTGEGRPIRWIGHRTLDGSQDPRLSAVWPVRVRAGAFGSGLPAHDLRLSPGHPVLVGADEDGRGGVLVPIMCLINGTSVAREPASSVTYWHVELDAHDILLAEGVPAESYFDMGGRGWFAAEDGALIDPDFVPSGENGRCRSVAVDGAQVEAERARLSGVLAATLGAQCAWDEAEHFAWVVA